MPLLLTAGLSNALVCFALVLPATVIGWSVLIVAKVAVPCAKAESF